MEEVEGALAAILLEGSSGMKGWTPLAVTNTKEGIIQLLSKGHCGVQKNASSTMGNAEDQEERMGEAF